MARGRGIVFRQKGDFGDAVKFLESKQKLNRRIRDILEQFGQKGLKELKEVTPKRTGKTAKSWSYAVKSDKNDYSLVFQNDNLFHGVPIVVLLVYGHATPSGKWVEGRDFITPVTEPLFADLQDQIRKEVTK